MKYMWAWEINLRWYDKKEVHVKEAGITKEQSLPYIYSGNSPSTLWFWNTNTDTIIPLFRTVEDYTPFILSANFGNFLLDSLEELLQIWLREQNRLNIVWLT